MTNNHLHGDPSEETGWKTLAMCAVTIVAMAWGVAHRESGVIVGALLKLAAIGALMWYLNTPRLGAMFVGSSLPVA